MLGENVFFACIKTIFLCLEVTSISNCLKPSLQSLTLKSQRAVEEARRFGLGKSNPPERGGRPGRRERRKPGNSREDCTAAAGAWCGWVPSSCLPPEAPGGRGPAHRVYTVSHAPRFTWHRCWPSHCCLSGWDRWGWEKGNRPSQTRTERRKAPARHSKRQNKLQNLKAETETCYSLTNPCTCCFTDNVSTSETIDLLGKEHIAIWKGPRHSSKKEGRDSWYTRDRKGPEKSCREAH